MKLVEECARIEEPIRDITPMASRLYDIISWVLFHQFLSLVSYQRSKNIQVIKGDAETWKAALLTHIIFYQGTIQTKNLNDCFRSFMVSHVSASDRNNIS
jgi:hypothetical protein